MTGTLEIRVAEVRGKCPVYRGGERIVIRGPEIDMTGTDRLCIHALASILHYAVALREGVAPDRLGLCHKGDSAFLQCLDPGPPLTPGGTVIFECRKV
jgi:uncharacterized repeat protein (TIGR04076 family)